MITADAWESYARKARPRRAVNAAGAKTWLNWTQYPDHGPNESVLGGVRDRAVLELGSGSGSNLGHLATLGARCVGVDLAPGRVVTAVAQWAHLPNVEFVTMDAVDYLTIGSTRFDIVYSIFGAVWFNDPGILLPLVRNRMATGGVFAFSHLPAVTRPPTERGGLIVSHNHSIEEWACALTAHGFGSVEAEVISAPLAQQAGTLLVRALAS